MNNEKTVVRQAYLVPFTRHERIKLDTSLVVESRDAVNANQADITRQGGANTEVWQDSRIQVVNSDAFGTGGWE